VVQHVAGIGEVAVRTSGTAFSRSWNSASVYWPGQ
jgi:hypothetical protein